MKYYIGVDGGGTKTRTLVFDESFNTVFDQTYSTCHLISIGVDKFQKLIKDIKTDLVNANIFSNAEYAFFGLAGFGEIEKDNEIMTEIITEVFAEIPTNIQNDSIAGWAGSLLCENGINVISGTGSIATGVKNGHVYRVGGWGYLFGDDGSAYWIALKALNAYSKMYDHRLVRTILYDIINEAYNLTSSRNFMYVMYTELKANRTEIAKVASLCSQAAEKGCQYSQAILQNAAKEMIAHLDIVANELQFGETVKISYSGGTFNSSIFLKYFSTYLQEQKYDYELVEDGIEPAHGSALYAYILKNGQIDEDIRKKLLTKYR